jgi:large subunit ribosomal protein L18
MNHERANLLQRRRRKFRVRKRLRGTTERPRLSVFRSLKHVYAQLIDDQTGKTLASASTADGDLKGQVKSGGNCAAAELVGRTIAERALAAGVKMACFDRGPCKYHGRLAALAEAARSAGLDLGASPEAKPDAEADAKAKGEGKKKDKSKSKQKGGDGGN